MSNFWIALGFLSYVIYSFSILQFAVGVLKYSKKSLYILIPITLFNACAFMVLYFYGVPWFFLYVVGYVGYLLEVKLLSKTSFRQIWFIATSYILSMISFHLITLLIIGIIFRMPLQDIYKQTNIFSNGTI